MDPTVVHVRDSTSSPTNSSSEPSPQAADAKQHLKAPSLPLFPSVPFYAADRTHDSESDPNHSDDQEGLDERRREKGQGRNEQETRRMETPGTLDETKLALARRSTGSIAATTRQAEALDYRRHTFTTVSAENRALMRRRSYDLSAHGDPAIAPPLSPLQQSLPHSFKAPSHLQHLYVYGNRASGSSKQRLTERLEEGSAMIVLASPTVETVWTRGKAVDVEWKVLDSKVAALRIELLEDGRSASTLIAAEAPNTGFFTYPKVPWGMESGSKYFLRVSAADNVERYCTSSFFRISSAP
ncbi:unnamed protein product [Hyaloperonospora brassicae]|uniref:Uncharacterized protein n=1 Tax=Hyaloperonospora brassicae TaxID=162125 RepID=A0AAV0UNI5_HYABA|nr:unnamed protein product [Hyaloperonospora brassicae]